MSTPSIDVANQLECAICNDQLWEPKLLNCGHTFCLKCLEELFEPEKNPQNPVVACPLCRKKTPVPGKGVPGLNTNFALQSLLEALSPALEPKTSADVAKVEDGEATLCELHKELKKFYCCTCEVLICRDCTVVDHPRPEHRSMNLDEAYTWRRQLNERELQLAMRVVKLAKRSQGILQSVEASLNDRCDQVIAEVERCREAGLEMLQMKAEAIEAFQVDLETEITALHDMTEDATKMDVLDQSKNLIVTMASLRDQQNEILEKPEPVQYPVFTETSKDVQDWPRLIDLGGGGKQSKHRKPRPKRQQSAGAGSQSQEGTGEAAVTDKFTPPAFGGQRGGGQRGRSRGYHHHRGRGGGGNSDQGSADNRGRGGYQHRGRGGKQGQGGGERGQWTGNK